MKGHPFTPTISDDHECQLRRSFVTLRIAKAAAQKIYQRTGKVRHPQLCRYCKEYHLGDAK